MCLRLRSVSPNWPRSPLPNYTWPDSAVCDTACGGRLRFIATIEDPPVVQRILAHVGLPTTVPESSPARPPPAAGDTLAFDFPG
jgi:hypothetical protein